MKIGAKNLYRVLTSLYTRRRNTCRDIPFPPLALPRRLTIFMFAPEISLIKFRRGSHHAVLCLFDGACHMQRLSKAVSLSCRIDVYIYVLTWRIHLTYPCTHTHIYIYFIFLITMRFLIFYNGRLTRRVFREREKKISEINEKRNRSSIIIIIIMCVSRACVTLSKQCFTIIIDLCFDHDRSRNEPGRYTRRAQWPTYRNIFGVHRRYTRKIIIIIIIII